jgi:hypothetical protein
MSTFISRKVGNISIFPSTSGWQLFPSKRQLLSVPAHLIGKAFQCIGSQSCFSIFHNKTGLHLEKRGVIKSLHLNHFDQNFKLIRFPFEKQMLPTLQVP